MFYGLAVNLHGLTADGVAERVDVEPGVVAEGDGLVGEEVLF